MSRNGSPNSEFQQLAFEAELEAFLRDRLPNYIAIKPATLKLVKVLFASVCFHESFLRKTLSQRNPFRASPLFRDIPLVLKQHARIAYPWAKTRYTPSFTGLPPHTLLFADNEEVKAGISSLRIGLRDDMREIMLERDPTANLVSNQMLNLLNTMADRLARLEVSANNNRLQNEGGSGEDRFRLNDGDQLFPIIDEYEMMDTDDAEPNSNETFEQKNLRLKIRREKEKVVVKARRLKVGFFKNKLQILPPEWTFPKMTSFQLVVNWLLTDIENNVPALRFLKPIDVKHLGKTAVVKLRMMRSVMGVVEKIAVSKNVWPAQSSMSYAAINNMWGVVQPCLFEKYGKDNQLRNAELEWKTLYNQMSKKKAFVSATLS